MAKPSDPGTTACDESTNRWIDYHRGIDWAYELDRMNQQSKTEWPHGKWLHNPTFDIEAGTDMETLEKDVIVYYEDPITGNKKGYLGYVMMHRDCACAKLMHYALSERNFIVYDLRNNENYQCPDMKGFVRLPEELYKKVKKAYLAKQVLVRDEEQYEEL
jgi:hypothetical protein